MSAKTLSLTRSSCIRCGGAAGPEVVTGDTVKLFLDTSVNGDFPEWVEGTIATVGDVAPLSGERVYTVQYESDHLEGAATAIRECDIVDVLCVGCCAIINDYLRLMKGVNIPNVSLGYTWEGTQLTLVAHAYSTQIASNPGVLVTIPDENFVFHDLDDSVISGDGNTREVDTPDTGDTDWPGGLFKVTVTDSEGLANEASVYVLPRPRFRRETVTLEEGEETVAVTLEEGEQITSVMAAHCTLGFFQFSVTEADTSVIQASAAPTSDLDLIVTIHTP